LSAATPLFSDSPASPLSPTSVKFTVFGKPQPQGSTRAFFIKSLGRAVITSDNKNLKPWRQQLSETAMALGAPLIGKNRPVSIAVDFFFERPKGASVKSRPGMTVKPDGDKLLRAVFDSLTGTIVTDDAQFVEIYVRKFYGLPERAEIQVGELL
jgi:Holliday junction resolvase RusA-like endonuclease